MYYIHWTVDRRSMRQSTRADEPRAALIALACWILTRYGECDIAGNTVPRRRRAR